MAVMADGAPVENSDYWRKRAEEARTMSERMIDGHTRVLMLGIAEGYERIAESYDLIAASFFRQSLDTK
ncbi:MAG: hypothetical protein ACTHJS_01835 [Xanthobacteraceae bacterium]